MERAMLMEVVNGRQWTHSTLMQGCRDANNGLVKAFCGKSTAQLHVVVGLFMRCLDTICARGGV